MIRPCDAGNDIARVTRPTTSWTARSRRLGPLYVRVQPGDQRQHGDVPGRLPEARRLRRQAHAQTGRTARTSGAAPSLTCRTTRDVLAGHGQPDRAAVEALATGVDRRRSLYGDDRRLHAPSCGAARPAGSASGARARTSRTARRRSRAGTRCRSARLARRTAPAPGPRPRPASRARRRSARSRRAR